jgi:7,8-dihydropterin-6-yl-methyl-4-(beta-D-ribofuranosyl)aminobenzene 5'-phosphate synthase
MRRDPSVPPLDRRRFMQGAATVIAASLAGPAFAQPSSPPPLLEVPQVDSLTLQILVDNQVFGPFLPDLALPGLRVTRGGGPGGARMSPRALMAEFGLSVLGESRLGAETRRVLVDFGYSREVLANNIALLGIDPDRIDAAVLSHGHLDHYGGFPGLFGAGGARHHLPLFVGGEETFCERVAMIGSPPPIMGVLDRAALARAGLRAQIAAAPRLIADQAFTTGIIPLETFERAAIPTRMRPGIGCRADLLSTPAKRAGETADDGEHELATCYHVRGLGLVVIASCSHRGVLNSVRRAQAVSGVERIHAVVGGFHLVRPRTEDEARRTAAAFVAMNPAYIVPMHCTGEVFIAEAMRLMPDKVIRPYVGSRFTFAT